MSDRLKIQGVVEMSSEGAEGALNRIGDKAGQMASKVATSAEKAGKAVDGIGDGASRSADEFTRSEGKIVASIKRATSQLEQMGKTASQRLEMRINTQGLDPAKFEPLLAKLREVEAAQDRVGGSAGKLPGAYDEITRSLGGLVTAAAGIAAVSTSLSKLVSVQREFDVINASLVTMTGSVTDAKTAFGALQQFAASTPFALQEVSGAFVKLKSLGLDPTQRALESFGNTASAMGKSLNQFIEAIADASTGEFERLKEFGIKANKEGESVRLTFRGVSTTIRNSSEEITEYLTRIGEVEFAGAMTERAKTLDGAIGNLADTWDNLFLTVSQNNAGGLIFESVSFASGAISDLTKIIQAMSSAASENAQATGAMATIQDGIGKTFETVAVLGANVAYVFRGIGTEIGGIAAQAAALLSGNFAGAKFIGEEMRRDAAAARAEVDALTERILGARAAAVATGASLDDLSKSRPTGKPPVDPEALKKAKKEAEELSKLLNTINSQGSGLSPEYVKNVETLLNGYDKGRLSLDQFNAAFSAYVAMQPGAIAAEKERTKALEEAEKARQDYMRGIGDETEKLLERATAAEMELETIGLSEQELAALTARRYDEQIAIKAAEAERLRGIEGRESELYLVEQQIEALARLKEVAAGKSLRQAQAKELEAVGREWERFFDDIERGLTDSIYRSFESGESFGDAFFDSLERMAKATVLKFGVQLVMDTGKLALGMALDAMTGGSSGGGLGSSLGLVSNASTAYQLYSGTHPIYGAYNSASTWASNVAAGVPMQYAGAVGNGAPLNFGGLFQNGSTGSLASNGAQAATAQTSMWANIGAGIGAGISAYSVGASVGQKHGYAAGTVAGTVAGAGTVAASGAIAGATGIGAGGAAAAGAAAGGGTAGAAAGASYALSAIPVWGWVAMAVLALFGATSGSKPKLKGDLVSSLFEDGEFKVTGQEQVGKRSLGGGDALTTISEAFAYTYSDLLTEFGQEANFALEAFYRTRTNGMGHFMVDDEMVASGKGKKYSLQNLFDDVMSRGLYNAIQGSALPDNVEKLFDETMNVGQMAEAITAVMGMNDALQAAGADLESFIGAMDFEQYRQEGERNIDVVSRMTATVLSANNVFERLGLSLFDLSASGFDAIKTLEGAFGGAEGLSQTLAGYYENFYTEEEKRARIIKDIGEQLRAAGSDITDADLGSKTRAEFREAYEAIVETAGAASPLAIAMLGVSGAFATVANVAEQTAQAAQRAAADAQRAAIDGADNAFAALGRAIDAEIDRIATRRDAQLESLAGQGDSLREKASLADAIGSSLTSAIDRLRGADAQPQSMAAARRDIDAMLQAAWAGQMPDQDKLSRALGVVTADSASNYASREDWLRAQAVQAGKLETLAELTENQGSIAEQQLEALEAQRKAIEQSAAQQISALDAQRALAQQQIDALKGVDGSVKSVESALREFNSAIQSAIQRAATPAAPAAPTTNPHVGSVPSNAAPGVKSAYNHSSGVNVSPADSALLAAAKVLYQSATGGVSTAQFNRAAASVGGDLAAAVGWRGDPAELRARYGFAQGTNYVPWDMTADIHQGERIIPAADNRQLMDLMRRAANGGGATIDLSALLEEVRMLRAEMRATAQHSGKTARLIERVIPDGDALAVRAAA